jgi:hypothetical protein
MRWMKWILIACLLLANYAHAEDITVYPETGVLPFLGLDDTSAPTQVKNGRAQDLQNVLLSFSGAGRQRYGVNTVIDSTDDGLALSDNLDIQDEDWCAVTGVYYTKFSSGTEKIIATCGGRLYELNGIASWDVVANGVVSSTATDQVVFTVALDNIIGTDDSSVPFQYDGTSVSSISFTGLSSDSPPSAAKTVIFFKNYLLFGNTVEGGTEYPTRFRYSNVGTINTWSDNDYLDIGALGGQEINCFAELYDTLIVGLTDSLYKVSFVGGADVFQISKITDDIGCIAKNSIQSITLTNAQSGLIFLDKDKRIYFYNGVIAQDISGLIAVTMDGLSGSRLQYAVSGDTNSDYWLCVTNGTVSTNNLCLDLQYEIGEWTKHTNVPANAMAHVIDNNSNDQIYWGSYKSLVYVLEDTALRDDVDTATGTVDTTDLYTTATASGLTVLYDSSQSLTTGALVGAPIKIVGGIGIGEVNTVADNTPTGIVVTDAFTATLDSTSVYEVGAIDSYYTTKWYDFGNPALLKHWLEIYFWAEADVSSTHSLSWADDYSSDISTESITLSSSTSDAIWGSAIWGTALWGDVDDIFRIQPLSGEGRYLRIKWAEDDPEETWNIYGFNILLRRGKLN